MGVDWSCDYGVMGMTLMNGDEGGGVGAATLVSPKGTGMAPSPGSAPPELAPREEAGQSLMMGRRCAPPALFPCRGLSRTGPRAGTLC